MEIIEQSHQILPHGTLESVELAGRTAYKSEDKITAGSAETFIKGIIKRGHESVLEHFPLVFRIPMGFDDSIHFHLAWMDQEVEGLNYSPAGDYMYISMNARTLRDAHRKVHNMLVRRLVTFCQGRYPVLFSDFDRVQCNTEHITEPTEFEVRKRLVAAEAEKHVYRMVKFITDRGVTHELVRHRRDMAFTQESTRYVRSANKPIAIDTKESVVVAYNSGLSMHIIAERSNGRYTEWDVYKVLDEFEVEHRRLGNHGVTHDDFFDRIDAPEKAYLLGFILADGSMHKDSNQVTISQHPDNSWFIVRMVRDFIKPSAIKAKDGGVSFCSDRLYSELFNKGLRPNKTHDFLDADAEALWSSVEDQFIPDFMRGFLDGDGSVRFFRQNNPGKTFSCNISWCGHQSILNRIQEWIKSRFEYVAGMHCISTDFWRLMVTDPAVGLKLCNALYEHFVFPYGHPAKATRMLEYTSRRLEFASWGDPKFKVIRPMFWDKVCPSLWVWGESMNASEDAYNKLTFLGATPQEARTVLPNSLKTEIITTTNIRQWKHIISLRDTEQAHPQMRALIHPLHVEFIETMPDMFGEG